MLDYRGESQYTCQSHCKAASPCSVITVCAPDEGAEDGVLTYVYGE